MPERRPPALLRAWRWIWEPSERKLHVASCPRCGETVVVNPGRSDQPFDVARMRDMVRLPQAPTPDEGQLLAACPDHGWAPYNERSLKLRGRRRD
jgi:hypothetical protein